MGVERTKLICHNILMINKLRQRELTGKPIKINYVYPLRDTKYVCYSCNSKIKGLIIDLPNDIDIFGCRDPLALP
jgi:hypothetical protein